VRHDLWTVCSRGLTLDFNPRAYVRHDLVEEEMRDFCEFQSTCLREARLHRRGDFLRVYNFNPRAYVRHDSRPIKRDGIINNFNPRAYVRHDVVEFYCYFFGAISIHVPT